MENSRAAHHRTMSLVLSVLLFAACGESKKEEVSPTLPTQISALREEAQVVPSPAIHCVAPANLAAVSAAPGQTQKFVGQILTPLGLSEVRVNGAQVTPDKSGQFTLDLPVRFGTNFLEISATDTEGQSSSRTYTFLAAPQWLPTEALLQNGASVKLTPQAMDDHDGQADFQSINDLLLTALRSDELLSVLHKALAAKGTLLDQCFVNVFGWCAFHSSIFYHEIRYGLEGPDNSDSSVTLTDRGIRVAATIRDLLTRVTVDGTMHHTVGWASLKDTHVEMLLSVRIHAGKPVVSLSDESVQVGSVNLDAFSGLSGFLINHLSGLFHGLIKGMVGDKIREYMGGIMQPMMDELISSVNLASLAPSFVLPRLDGTGTVKLGVGFELGSISINPARMLLGLAINVSADAQVKQGGPGIAVNGTTELFDPQISSPLAAVLHGGLLNQMLHALWRAGYFDVSMTGAALGVDLIPNLTLSTRADLPPVLDFNLETRKVRMMLGGMMIRVDAPDTFERPFEAEVGAVAGASINLEGELVHFQDLEVSELTVSAVTGTLTIDEQVMVKEMLMGMVQTALQSSLTGLMPVVPLPTFKLPEQLKQFGLPTDLLVGLSKPVVVFTPQHMVVEGKFLSPVSDKQPQFFDPVLCTPFGGYEMGDPYNDWDRYLVLLKKSPRITRLTLRSADRVDQLTQTYEDGTRLQHGRNGGRELSINLAPGEHLTTLEVHKDTFKKHARIFFIQFGTNQRNPILAGGNPRAEPEKKHIFTAPWGYQISGFIGSSGDELDSVAPVFTPAP